MAEYGPQAQAQQGGFAWMPGATTIGTVFTDGVILASEKRVTYGNFIASKGGNFFIGSRSYLF
jgi:20S proteasome alpha/beta subunit